LITAFVLGVISLGFNTAGHPAAIATMSGSIASFQG
jgi:hypothetical protein